MKMHVIWNSRNTAVTPVNKHVIKQYLEVERKDDAIKTALSFEIKWPG